MVGTYEEKIFNKRTAIRDKKLRRLISDNENSVSSCIFYLKKCKYINYAFIDLFDSLFVVPEARRT